MRKPTEKEKSIARGKARLASMRKARERYKRDSTGLTYAEVSNEFAKDMVAKHGLKGMSCRVKGETVFFRTGLEVLIYDHKTKLFFSHLDYLV